jgi:Matrixin
MRLSLVPCSMLLMSLSFCRLEAGGPIQVFDHRSIKWNMADPIPYKIDQGPLGEFDAAQIGEMVREAFNAWSNVPSAGVAKFVATDLREDVKSAKDYVRLRDDHTKGNLVLFDSNGEFIDDFTYKNGKKNVLGWAKPFRRGDRIVRFVSVFNGYLAHADQSQDLRLTLVHEFGHALGLDHSQIQWETVEAGLADPDGFVPTMYPTSVIGPPKQSLLHPDDVAWISKLYPLKTTAATDHGTLIGRLVHHDGTPVLGSNVVAIRTSDEKLRFSCASDWLMNNDGAFEIPVVPGVYTIVVEPIRDGFDEGSSVGAYSADPSGEAFIHPVIRTRFKKPIEVKPGNTNDIGELRASAPLTDGK